MTDEAAHSTRAQMRGNIAMMAEGLKRSSETMDMTQSPIYQETLLHLGPGRRVLDIGAGVGRFTGPLAAAGCSVVAIEPSAEMLPHLTETLARFGVSNQVQVMHSAWPIDQNVHADVALAAFVIQFSGDFAAFARAMEKSAEQRCILAVHVDPIMAFLEPFWKLFHPDEPAPRMPDFADIYPALLADGIVADVRIFSEAHGPRWTDATEAIPMIAGRLGILEDQAAMERLREVVLQRREDIVRPPQRRAALISWAP